MNSYNALFNKTLLICSLLFVQNIYALPKSSYNETYSVICIGQDSNGFHWENGEWEHAHFYPGKFLIRKYKIPPFDKSKLTKDDPIQCSMALADKLIEYKNMYNFFGYKLMDFGCYGITQLDKKNHTFIPDICGEKYKKDGTIDEVTCREVRFKPNGYFYKVRWLSTSLEDKPENDYNDDLTITFGRCTKID